MSITDPIAEPVQPDEGQGGEGGGNPAYAEYLNRIPEDARGAAEEAFKAWDANYQRTSQEAAEYRRGWDPYEQIGVNNFAPDAVGSALQVYQAIQSDPQQVVDWLVQEYGLTPAQAQQQVAQEQQQQQQQDGFGSFDQFGDPTQLQSLLDQRLGPLAQQLEALNQRFAQQEQQAREAQVAEQLNAEMAAIKATPEAQALPEKIRGQFDGWLGRFANEYAVPGADPKLVVARAWADMQAVFSEVAKDTLKGKLNQPAAAESGGTPDVTPEPIKDLATAARIAQEHMRAQRG